MIYTKIMKKVNQKNIKLPSEDLQNKAKKINLNPKGFDWVLVSIFILLSIVFLFFIYQLNMLDFRFVSSIGVVLIVAISLFVFLLIRRQKYRWTSTLYRVLLAAGIGLLGYGSYTLWNIYDSLTNITRLKESTVEISLLSKSDSSIHTIEDFANKKIGYSSALDNSAASVAMADINTEVATVEYVDMSDYQQLYEKLMNGEIDGLIIPNNRINLLQEQYKKLKEEVKTVQTFSMTRNIDLDSLSTINLSQEPFVVYIAGLDEGEDTDIDSRSDTNILLMVDPVNNQMTTISIPRNSYIPNPALSNGSDRLMSLGNDGVDNSMEGIEEAFGIDIDFYVKVNFESLIHIVDALGGIEVDVKLDFTEQDENRSFADEDLITLHQGVQTLNGKQALAYARHRKTDGYGDTGRENAQQQIIQAIMKKLATAEGVSHINALMRVAQKYVSTNIPFESLQSFISNQLTYVKPWSVDSITLKSGVDATLTTVSLPSKPLKCYLLSPNDLARIYNAYERMYFTPDLKDFKFNLSSDPQCTISYKEPQEISQYMITSADASLLNSYSVYYGVERIDTSNAQVSEERAQNEQIEVIAPAEAVQPEYVPTLPQEPTNESEETPSSEEGEEEQPAEEENPEETPAEGENTEEVPTEEATQEASVEE